MSEQFTPYLKKNAIQTNNRPVRVRKETCEAGQQCDAVGNVLLGNSCHSSGCYFDMNHHCCRPRSTFHENLVD